MMLARRKSSNTSPTWDGACVCIDMKPLIEYDVHSEMAHMQQVLTSQVFCLEVNAA
jgi:hypothetical protein